MEADLAAVEVSRSNSKLASRIDPAELADLEGSLYRYNKAVWPIIEGGHPYVDGWHIGCVCEHLQAVLELQINNLIINIPPRHGKSVAGAVSWFTWGWARQPALRWMYSSYADNLVVRDANASRRLIESTWYQDRWGHRVQFGRKNTDEWFENTATGYRISTTVGGKALGHGADILVTDDPMKALDARSVAERLRIIEWWTKTMSTRINDPKKVRKVIIMQRLHEADLAGYLSARGDGYEVLVLPAEYEPKRVFFMRPDPKPRDAIIMTSLQRERPECRDPRTVDGELLWPARFGRKEIDALKIELEADGVAGQLQQRPSPADGTVFQRPHFRYAVATNTSLGASYVLYGADGKEAKRVQIARCRFIQTVDTAVKAKQNNDPTAVGTFAITPDGDLIIIHMAAERIEIPYQLAFLKAMRRGPALWIKAQQQIIPAAVPWPRPLLGQWIEDAASGTMLLATGGISEGIAFRSLKHGGKDKVQRAAPLSALYQAGRVYHLRGGAWLVGYEDEISVFPSGTHDDMTDCAAYAARVALYDELVRAGLSGLDDVAADYANPEADPDDPGAVRRPWTLQPGETLDTMPEPEIVVSLGDDDNPTPVTVRDGAAPVGWRDPAHIPGIPTPPPAPDGEWSEILFDQLRDQHTGKPLPKPPAAPPPMDTDDDLFSLE